MNSQIQRSEEVSDGESPNDRERLLKTTIEPDDSSHYHNYKACESLEQRGTISERQDALDPTIISPDENGTRGHSLESAGLKGTRVKYSLSRARFASTLILVLYAMGPVNLNSIIAQYLDRRWLDEANLNETKSANHSSCQEAGNSGHDHVQARVSTETMYYSYTFSIPATFSCLVLGAYCDEFGRRMIFILPILGAIAKLSISFAIMRYDLDVNFFFLASGLDGLTGSVFAILVASYTVSADISTEKASRIIWSVFLTVFADVIISSSSIASGYLVDYFGFSVALIFLTCPVVLSLLCAIFLLPETKPELKYGTTRRTGSVNLWNQVVRMVRMYTSEGDFRHRVALFMLLVLFFFTALVLLNATSVDTLYQMRKPFCWSATLIGYYGAARNAGQATLGGIYLKIMQLLGWVRDEKVAMIGCLFKAASAVLEAFVQDTWSFFMVPVLGFPGFVSIGIIRGVMSLLVGPYNQGALFATVAFVESICNIVGATIFNQVYAATVSTWPGTVFIVMAAMSMLTFCLFFVFFYFYDEPTTPHNRTLTVEAPQVKPQEDKSDPT